MSARPEWDDYFLELAAVAAKRSTCTRKQVGCIITLNRRVLTTGYGGSIRGQPHCTEVGCEIDPATGGCIRTVHAEMNAIAQAAANGVGTQGATAYTTLSPCYWCFKTMVNAGIVRFCYSEQYRIPIDPVLVHGCGVSMEHHGMSATERAIAQDSHYITSDCPKHGYWRVGLKTGGLMQVCCPTCIAEEERTKETKEP